MIVSFGGKNVFLCSCLLFGKYNFYIAKSFIFFGASKIPYHHARLQ